ncbi:MYND-type zinc finger protein samB [Abortiporus biennis]
MTEKQPLCAVCGIPTVQRCSRCKAAYYCSSDHMKKDWPNHKPTCREAGSKVQTVTAVLFPVDEDKPRLVQVEYTIEPDDEYEGTDVHELNLEPWFNSLFCTIRPCPIEKTDGFSGQLLDRTLHMKFNDDFMISGDPLNRCIQRSVPGGPGHEWCGNIMVFRVKEPTSMICQYYDATIDDIQPTLNYLRDYGRVRP